MTASDNGRPGTDAPDYATRLQTLEQARWKQLLDVQAPYRWNIRRLGLGRTLDVGCRLGRNLAHLDGRGVERQLVEWRKLVQFRPDACAGK